MKKLHALFFFAAIISLNQVYSQTEVHSGIIHTTEVGEETNLIKIHCDELSNESNVAIIQSEFSKYAEIKSVDFDLINLKMYVKYNDLIDANLLLGILERVAITAYYNNGGGTPVYYSKTGTESFRR